MKPSARGQLTHIDRQYGHPPPLSPTWLVSISPTNQLVDDIIQNGCQLYALSNTTFLNFRT